MQIRLAVLPGALATTFVCATLLASCGGGGNDGASADASATTAAAHAAATTSAPPTAAAPAAFEFGDDPRLTPVEVVLTAGAHGFDAKAFESAFASKPDCAIDTYAGGRTRDVDAGTIAGTTASVTAGDDADHAVVDLMPPGASEPEEIPVVQVNRKWYVDEDPCRVLGIDGGAPARAAEADLRNVLTAAKTIYTDSETYQAATVAYMHEVEPSLQFAAINGARAGVVGIGDVTANQIVLVTQSADGEWFCIADVATGSTTYGRAATRDAIDTVAECTAPSWG